jgi:hypothetical protein
MIKARKADAHRLKRKLSGRSHWHPGSGYYSVAKAAREGLSGSLRKAVEPLGLRVMMIEPGSFRTDFRGRSADRSSVRIDAYYQVLGRTGTSTLSPQHGAPDKAAAAILQAAEDSKPPKLLLLGSEALDGFHTAARDIDRSNQLPGDGEPVGPAPPADDVPDRQAVSQPHHSRTVGCHRDP